MAKKTFRILFSCIGRRVALVEAFRRSCQRLGLESCLIGADNSPYSAALQRCDKRFLVPASIDKNYLDEILDLCRRENVNLLIPLIDPELLVLAGQQDKFAEVGTTLCLSDAKVVKICRDKVRTFRTLTDAGIDTPRLFRYDDITDADLPLFMKPRAGSAARNIHRLSNRESLDFYHRTLPTAIIQELIEGQEYTLDVFTDFLGRPRCVVPRIRLEVRSGEVSKSMTVKDQELMALGRRTVEALPGCRGPLTIQCFRTRQGRLTVIEINPRLGGGVPLSIEAGADIPAWTIQCALGQEPDIDPAAFRERLVMLRYDDAVFINQSELQK